MISKKKGSIFKSRSLVDGAEGAGRSKRRALYRHKWTDDSTKDVEKDQGGKSDEGGVESTSTNDTGDQEYDFQNDSLVRVIKDNPDGEVTSVRLVYNL